MLGIAKSAVLRDATRGEGMKEMEGGKGVHNSEQSCGTEKSPSSAKGTEQSTVSVVCSLYLLWSSIHYCIQAKGQVKAA